MVPFQILQCDNLWGIWIWGRPSLISSVDKSDSSEKKWNHFLYQIIYRKVFKGKNLSNTRIEMIIDKPLVGLIKSVWNQLCCFFFFIEDFVVLEWSQLSQSLGLNNWKKFLAGRYHEFFFLWCYHNFLLSNVTSFHYRRYLPFRIYSTNFGKTTGDEVQSHQICPCLERYDFLFVFKFQIMTGTSENFGLHLLNQCYAIE